MNNKRLGFRVLLLVCCTIGAIGVTAGALMAREPVQAACADYECEVGMFCQENTGGNTYCARQDNSNQCQTKGCQRAE